jgi:hypothetical protein
MKLQQYLVLVAFTFGLMMVMPYNAAGQACTGYNGYTCDNCIPCGPGIGGPCCSVWKACNGPGSPCNTYEAGNGSDGQPAVNGCDMACTPIDSGVLFLLLGGAAFGGMMIMRRRQEALEVVRH